MQVSHISSISVCVSSAPRGSNEISQISIKFTLCRKRTDAHDPNEMSIFVSEFGRVPSFPTRGSDIFRRDPERWFRRLAYGTSLIRPP